jgi:tRNA (Thr-GGU) A37 N-methylase
MLLFFSIVQLLVSICHCQPRTRLELLIHCFLHLQPVLDIKPYLPYSDSVKGAAIPNWLEVQTMWHAILCITLSL